MEALQLKAVLKEAKKLEKRGAESSSQYLRVLTACTNTTTNKLARERLPQLPPLR